MPGLLPFRSRSKQCAQWLKNWKGQFLKKEKQSHKEKKIQLENYTYLSISSTEPPLKDQNPKLLKI